MLYRSNCVGHLSSNSSKKSRCSSPVFSSVSVPGEVVTDGKDFTSQEQHI